MGGNPPLASTSPPITGLSPLATGQSTALQSNVGEMAWQVAALHGVALVYQAQGRFRESLEQFDKVIPLADNEEIGAKYDQAAARIGKAFVSHASGRHKEALDLLQEVFRFASNHGHGLTEIDALSRMAWPLSSIGKPVAGNGRGSEDRGHLARGRQVQRSGHALRNFLMFADMYQATHQFQHARKSREEALALNRTTQD